jgi:hypothetical protein
VLSVPPSYIVAGSNRKRITGATGFLLVHPVQQNNQDEDRGIQQNRVHEVSFRFMITQFSPITDDNG